MKRVSLADMTTEQLVQTFAEMAVQQEVALLSRMQRAVTSTERAGIQRVARARIDVARRRVAARRRPRAVGARRGGPGSALLRAEVLRRMRGRQRRSQDGVNTAYGQRRRSGGRGEGRRTHQGRCYDEGCNRSHKVASWLDGCAQQ